MILYQEVKSSTELEGEDYEKRNAFATAACPAAATATAEFTIEEIAVGKQDKAPVWVQQGVAMGAEEDKFTTTGGGHASFEVLTTVGGKKEFLKWGCLTAIRSSPSHTFQPPAYLPKPSKPSRKSAPVMSRNKPVGHLPTPKSVVDHTTETEGDYHYQETVTMSASSATHTFMQGCTRVEGITVERGKAEYYDIPGGGHASIQVFKPVAVHTTTTSPVEHLPAAGTPPAEDLLGTVSVQVQVENMG